MKKTYVQPKVEVLLIEPSSFCATSASMGYGNSYDDFGAMQQFSCSPQDESNTLFDLDEPINFGH